MAGLCERCIEREARSPHDLFCDICERELRRGEPTTERAAREQAERERDEALFGLEALKRVIKTSNDEHSDTFYGLLVDAIKQRDEARSSAVLNYLLKRAEPVSDAPVWRWAMAANEGWAGGAAVLERERDTLRAELAAAESVIASARHVYGGDWVLKPEFEPSSLRHLREALAAYDAVRRPAGGEG